MDNLRERRKKSFGKSSKIYDRLRPDYPQETVNDILAVSGLKKDETILETGCGTGKATLPFAQRGYKIVALDISPELIKIAKKNLVHYPNVQFVTRSLEKSNLPLESFGLIFFAQSFYWINPKTRYQIIYSLLKNNHYLAIFSNHTDKKKSKIEEKVQNLYSNFCPCLAQEYNIIGKFKKELKISGLFKNIKKNYYHRIIKYPIKDYLKLQSTFSWIATLPIKKKTNFFQELRSLLKNQKTVSVPWKTILLLAQKKD